MLIAKAILFKYFFFTFITQSVDPGGNEQRSILGCLFWRLGVEAGYWLRTVHSAGIVWGYFFDHDEFIPHCNAHPNNLIVLPPGKVLGIVTLNLPNMVVAIVFFFLYYY